MQDLRYELAKYLHIDDFLSFTSCCHEFRDNLDLQYLSRIYELYQQPKNLKHLCYIWSKRYYCEQLNKTVVYKTTFNSQNDLIRAKRSIKRGWFTKEHLEDFNEKYFIDDLFLFNIHELRLRFALQNKESDDYNLFFHREEPIIVDILTTTSFQRKSICGLFIKHNIPFEIKGTAHGLDKIKEYYSVIKPMIDKKYDYSSLSQEQVKYLFQLLIGRVKGEKDRIETALNIVPFLQTYGFHLNNIKSCQGLAVYLACLRSDVDFNYYIRIFIEQRRQDLLETLLKYLRPRSGLDIKELDSAFIECIKHDAGECYLTLIQYYPESIKFIGDYNITGYDMRMCLQLD